MKDFGNTLAAAFITAYLAGIIMTGETTLKNWTPEQRTDVAAAFLVVMLIGFLFNKKDS